ncbi:MAG TPA: SpvB/TcaC N-terminal domain-containing protein [Desulfatiglandales bacterium]|nr:SpvB/TcaC N-terminal domain-containing protein [Desulfatiglandales bacterium]
MLQRGSEKREKNLRLGKPSTDLSSSPSQTGGETASLTPSVSLPKGGGAIKGIDEKFSVNPVSGTASLSIPIYTTPGRSGFYPKLSLDYDSGSGNGPFGVGWNLSIPSITRKTDKGLPRYYDGEESDTYVLSGAEDLVPALEEDKHGDWARVIKDIVREDGGNNVDYTVYRYRPRIEGLFARIERWQNKATGDVHWRSISKDNVTSIYGKSPGSRIVAPDDSSRVFKWLLEETYDDKGNVMIYEYKQENQENVDRSLPQEKNTIANNKSCTNKYLKRIKYANKTSWKLTSPLLPGDWLMEVVFDYGEHDLDSPDLNEPHSWPARPDAFSSYRAGFEIRTRRLCHRVLMFHHFKELGSTPCLVRSTDFHYDGDPVTNYPDYARVGNPIVTYLVSATQTGYFRKNDAAPYTKKSLPPLEFSYTKFQVNEEIHAIDAESLENLPIGLDGAQYRWVDLDGEGIAGILTEQADALFYKRNLGDARFGPLQRVAAKPSLGNLRTGQAQIMDLAGDGQKDLVLLDEPFLGFYERKEDNCWNSFVPFVSSPQINWRDPNLRLVDLTGDGHADVLITEDEVFTWYLSRAEEGFGPAESVRKELDEEKGPALVFADATQSVYLADMSGDGLSDIVRIKNGEVCYWPNLGYGRFGAKVTMDAPPYFDSPDLFDQARLRLADIDGSSTTDVIYFGAHKISFWRNQSGNSWSEPQELNSFPPTDNLSSVMVADLLGNGTTCLVWSSPLPGNAAQPLCYIDLMGGKKPHLLESVVNNMGAKTGLQYAPSTKFYLEDLKTGKPWITKLPFPVHAVERVEVFDHISKTKLVTAYRYHHGYFDGDDREFRGFGMVEQWDTEYFDQYNMPGLFESGFKQVEEGFHVPPVHTITWFHTGFYKDRDHISTLYKDEYYKEDHDAKLLPDTILPDGLTAQEEHEACRALKGRLLRREIHALDQSEKSSHPYQVIESNYRLVKIQPVKDSPHAVFFAHENETLQYHYERYPDDPRMSHSMILEVDEKYGHVKKAVAIAYPRRPKEVGPEHEPEQRQTLITYTESEFIDLDDELYSYRIGIPCEVKNYEITGLHAQGANPFKRDEILEVKGFDEIEYNERPTEGLEQKRLIEHSRILYYGNDLSGPMELGAAGSPALPYKRYQLVFTPEIINEVFSQDPQDPDDPPIHITETLLRDEARYVKERDFIEGGLFPASSGQDNWWVPSGHHEFNPDQFYLPVTFIDPFLEPLSLAYITVYDEYSLLVERARDPFENEVKAANDYRTMQPYLVTGPNGNRSQVAFDALGMVVGTAVMGKEGETRGDSLEGFDADLDDQVVQDHMDDPFSDPHAILQQATTRMAYDLSRFHRSREANPDDETAWQPVVVYTLARETHDTDLGAGEQTKIQHNFLYSDGLGREVQTKIQAEPGDVNAEHTERRWVGSGWTIYNNKGKPVKQYEPFFSPTHEFENNAINGVSAVLFYDPLERVAATLHPNNTYEKVVFDPWTQETWDVNDTLSVGPPNDDQDVGFYFDLLDEEGYLPTWYDKMMSGTSEEQDVAERSLRHAQTPGIVHLDVLGRTYLTIEQNTVLDDDRSVVEIVTYKTHVTLDIKGNPLLITDARDNRVMSYVYDIAGRQLFQHSMSAGKRWVLANIAGNPIRAWDNRKNQLRTLYDELQRPTHMFVKNLDEEGSEFLAEHTIYGERRPDAENYNLLGQIYRHCDGAGVTTNEAFDFRGNLLRGSRQLVGEYMDRVDWSQDPELEDEIFTSSTSYDALNRPIKITTPHTENAERNIPPNILQPVYNEANLLEKLDVWLRQDNEPEGLLDPETADIFAVTNIDYNEKGQRISIEYGNNTRTEYTYDEETFRLTNLKTSSLSEDGDLQNLSYLYDPIGNITNIRDNSKQAIFFNNTVVEPSARYEHDALYRLILAEGREHIGQASGDGDGLKPLYDHNDSFRSNLPHPNDGQAMRRYAERYEYDEVGNILRVIHQAVGGGWTRRYDYEQGTNQLRSTSLPGDPDEGELPTRYLYDPHGNMIEMPHLPAMDWDFKDQLHAVQKQVVNNGVTPEKAYYLYDAGGQRVRKVRVRSNGSMIDERIYLGGFEIYRRWDGDSISKETETLHIMDDQNRIALVETCTCDNRRTKDNPEPVLRYQIGNHLGSSSLELDENGDVISYEEYYPYGSTSYQAAKAGIDVSLKRYRYTGKERDEESGLYYYGARYYAPWLGRWTSCDPIGVRDGLNLYRYVADNPIYFIDRRGTQGVPEWARERIQGLQERREKDKRENIEELSKMKNRIRESSKKPSPWYLEKVLPLHLAKTKPGSDIRKQFCSEESKQCYTPSEHAYAFWEPETRKVVGFYTLGTGGMKYYNLEGEYVGSGIYDPAIESCLSPIDFIGPGAVRSLFGSVTYKFATKELWIYSTRKFAFDYIESGKGAVIWASAYGPGDWLYKRGLWNSILRSVRTGKWKPFPKGEEYIRQVTGSAVEHFTQLDAFGPFRWIKGFVGKQYSTTSPAQGLHLSSGTLIPASPHQMSEYLLHRLGVYLGDPLGIPGAGFAAGATYLRLKTGESQQEP